MSVENKGTTRQLAPTQQRSDSKMGEEEPDSTEPKWQNKDGRLGLPAKARTTS